MKYSGGEIKREEEEEEEEQQQQQQQDNNKNNNNNKNKNNYNNNHNNVKEQNEGGLFGNRYHVRVADRYYIKKITCVLNDNLRIASKFI